MKIKNDKIQLILIIFMGLLYSGLMLKMVLDNPVDFLRVWVPIFGGGAFCAFSIYGILMLILPKE